MQLSNISLSPIIALHAPKTSGERRTKSTRLSIGVFPVRAFDDCSADAGDLVPHCRWFAPPAVTATVSFSRFPQCRLEVAARLIEGWIEQERLAEMDDRLIDRASFRKDDAEAVVGPGIGRRR